jgi:hypothetical protein
MTISVSPPNNDALRCSLPKRKEGTVVEVRFSKGLEADQS